MEQSHEYKTTKYEDLKNEQEKEGNDLIVKVEEIGARGLVVDTLCQFGG